MKNSETVPNLLAILKSHQERPPKSVIEPPKRSRRDPTYVKCLNHPKVVSGGTSAAVALEVSAAPVEKGGGEHN